MSDYVDEILKVIKQFKPAKGKNLNKIANQYGLTRKNFFRIPYESDKKFRNRILETIKCQHH